MKSIITNTRDLLNSISAIENEINGINKDIVRLKSSKATITQPTDNQLLTWNEDLSMVEDSLWQLPAADGAANEIIYTDGAGNLGWIAPGAAAVAGADTQVQYNAAGAMAAEAAFTYDYNTNTLTADHYQATIDFTPNAADGATLGTAALEFSDLYLADGSVIYFGDDQDVTLTHIPDTGLILNSNMQFQFRDAQLYIASLNDGHLDLEADTQIDLNSTVYIETCIDAGADVDKFLVLDAANIVDYRTGAEVRADIEAAPAAHGVAVGYVPYASAATTWGATALQYSNALVTFGIGVAPAVNIKFYCFIDPTNATRYNGYFYSNPSVTVNGAYGGYALNAYCYTNLANAAITDTAAYHGIYMRVYHMTAGTVAGTYGLRFRYGTYGAVAANIGTNVGILMDPYRQGTGTIDTHYDIYISTPVGSAAVTNDWCIYSAHDAPSRLINDLQIDDDTYGIVLGDGQDTRIYYDGSDLVFDILTSGDFYFANGNIGVGTASPGCRVHAYKSTDAEVRAETTGSSSYSILGLGTDNNTRAGYLIAYGSAHGSYPDILALKNTYGSIDFSPGAAGAWTTRVRFATDGGVFMYALKSGATQAAAGAAANELWETSGHASLPDHVLMLGA